MPRSRQDRVLMTVAGAALLIAGVVVTAAIAAAPAKPGITVRTSPLSQSITQGGQAHYTISVSSTGSFAGRVGLAARGLPRGASATFAPSAVSVLSNTATTARLTVTTSAAPAGSYGFTITATSGRITGSVSAHLTVNRPPASSLSMSVTPRTFTVGAGSVAGYAVRLGRVNLHAPIGLAVVGALPPGWGATFTSNPAPGTASRLRVSTSATTTDGDYCVNIVASGPDPSGRMRYAYARVELVVHTVHPPFGISGEPAGLLGPGVSRPIDLMISNPNIRPLAVTNLTVTVRSVTRTGWAVARNLPCGTADYAVRQYRGAYPLGVTARGRASLSGLHVATLAWPAISMLDRPVNQDGCKGATLSLAYTGSGQGS
jgi:uncharacterized membrane protein